MSLLPMLENEPATGKPEIESPRSVPPGLRILLLTPYTGGNLGDAAIQEAVIHHLRKRLTAPQIQMVTLSPRATSRLHGLPSFPIASSGYDEMPSQASGTQAHAEEQPVRTNSFKDLIKRRLQCDSRPYRMLECLIRPVRRVRSSLRFLRREPRHLVELHRLLKDTDLLVMSGGGQIDDYWGGAFGHPYALFKWASLARMTGTPVLFLSVGVGRLGSRLGRAFAHRALRLAAYRSYRDKGSRELLRDIAFTRADPVFPDLAFSHPCVQQRSSDIHNPGRNPLVIGVSPIVYLSRHVWPERNPEVYERYLQMLCAFTEKLLTAGHTIVLFTSASMDQFAVEDMQAKLREGPKSQSWRGRLKQVDQTSLDKQLEEIRKMDIVIASRLHGIILAHLLGKSALALSYDRKVDAHMEAMAQKRYCLNIRNFTLAEIQAAFGSLALDAPGISESVRAKVREYADALDTQYHTVAEIMAKRSRKSAARSMPSFVQR